jgi:hypothetical protein
VGAVARMPRQGKVASAAQESHLALLIALRDRIASDIDSGDVPPRDMAALARRLLEIAKEIDALQAKGDSVSIAAVTPDDSWPG